MIETTTIWGDNIVCAQCRRHNDDYRNPLFLNVCTRCKHGVHLACGRSVYGGWFCQTCYVVYRIAKSAGVAMPPFLDGEMTMRHNERGSILVQVGLLLLLLTGVTAWVADYGLLWVARRQAQNAADAAALSGAIARAFDEPGVADPAPDGITVENINLSVDQHAIAGMAGTESGRTWSWDCPSEWPGSACVRVNVFRNGEEGSPGLPVFFGYAIGVTQQHTRATATAVTTPAAYANCLKPWLIPDKWHDNDGDGTFTEGVDTYTQPGWTSDDIGTTLTLSPGNPHQAIAPSDFYQLTDGNDYPEAILDCTLQAGIGDEIEVFPGLSSGLTIRSVEQLIDDNGGPVTVLVGMFDPAAFDAQARQSGKYDLEIVNIMGFQITGMSGRALYGTIVGAPGDIRPGYENVGGSLLWKIMLVR